MQIFLKMYHFLKINIQFWILAYFYLLLIENKMYLRETLSFESFYPLYTSYMSCVCRACVSDSASSKKYR